MRKRTWLSVLLASVLAVCLLAGCAGTGNEQGTDKNAPTEKTSIKIGGSSTLAPIIAKSRI
jgi:ABC-type phosphate transport system substrate-binding protein